MTSGNRRSGLQNQGSDFATTRWSVVLAAGKANAPDADNALDDLCRTYWYPLYAFCRRKGYNSDDAADLTQEFFARLIEREFLLRADRRRGRFRAFVLTVFKRFLSKERDRDLALKRGGGRRRLSIDTTVGEKRYRLEPADVQTPEALFERRWAVTLLERVMERLREEYASRGKLPLFEHCKGHLTGSIDPVIDETASRDLKMSPGALRVAIHRLRRRYRELLKDEVAQTVESPAEVEDELRHLRRAIRGE